MGIVVFSAGRSPGDVTVDISGNHIKNTTGSAINIRRVNGKVRVVSNGLETSRALARNGNEVLRVANTGAYEIADNSILCKWANGTGITLLSQYAEWPMEGATVQSNTVQMSPPAGPMFGDSSAGITVRGIARDVLVRGNFIRGRARAGVAVYISRGGVPESNALIDNRFDGFTPTVAEIFVGSGAKKTRIVTRGAVKDEGEGTVIERPAPPRTRTP
jgi:hypothetical protein